MEKLEKYGISQSKQSPSQDATVSVEIWGTGKPMREFLWSEEMADACVYLMENINFSDVAPQPDSENPKPEIRNTHINIGTGHEISIKDLAGLVKKTVGFKGDLFLTLPNLTELCEN